MNLSFTEEQILLKDSISKFCSSDYDFENRMKSVNSEKGYSPEHWRMFAELGWLAVPFSEEYGGLDGDQVDLSVVFEEFGKSLVVEPYLSNIVLAGGVLRRINWAEKGSVIEDLVSGSKQISLANYEPQKGYNLSNIDTAIDADGNLNGSKSTVLNAPNADFFLVFTKNMDNFAFALVPKDAEGLEVKGYKTYDGFVSGELIFKNCKPEALISDENSLEVLDNVILDALVCICSEAIGAMEKSYQLTIEYTKQREQFGQSLSKFQALQHRMVDMFMETEYAKSFLIKVLATEDYNERVKLTYGLKNQISKAGKQVGEEAVQLHGGMGVTEEMSIGHYLKRLMVIANIFGSADYYLSKYIEK